MNGVWIEAHFRRIMINIFNFHEIGIPSYFLLRVDYLIVGARLGRRFLFAKSLGQGMESRSGGQDDSQLLRWWQVVVHSGYLKRFTWLESQISMEMALPFYANWKRS